MKKIVIISLIIFHFILIRANEAPAKRSIALILESAVDISINNSYQIKLLEMQIRRSMLWLKARKANLKTQVYMNLTSPDLKRVSDYKWNSQFYRDEIVMQNTQLWQSDLSIKQPVIVLGYPTNGYLSLNYKLYRYLQKDNGVNETDFYNRLYIKFEQPFFLPNTLKNNLEEAELNLKDIKLEYISRRMDIIANISDSYYDLFTLCYKKSIYKSKLSYLEQLREITAKIVDADSTRKIENTQLALEYSNVRENLLANQSSIRLRMSDLMQRLRIDNEDSLYIIPEIKLTPINVNLEQAMQYGYENSPMLQRLQIFQRRAEIDVDAQKGRNAFHMTLEMTYGLEKKNQQFETLWERFDNSNSITLNAYIPIWDGGNREARIQAEQVDVRRRELQIIEEKQDIENDIVNFFTNLGEQYQRAVNMKESLELAADITEQSIEQYANNGISLQDLLQIINRHQETEEKFLDVYIGYRRSLLGLMRHTYYNFEKDMPCMEEFEAMFGG